MGKLIVGFQANKPPTINPMAPNVRYVVPIVKVSLEPKEPKTGAFITILSLW